MPTPSKTLVDLETKFWQSIVDHDADTAIDMLCEPAVIVSSHGAMKFDHATYRKMAAEDSTVVKSFQLEDMQVVFPNDTTAVLTYRAKQEVASRDGKPSTLEMNDSSTWVKSGDRWQCVMHTETPVEAKTKH